MAVDRKSTEIRTSRKAERLGTLAGWVMRLYSRTFRLEVIHRSGLDRPGAVAGPVVYCLWHDSIFVVPPAWSRTAGRHRQVVVLTSASKDGATLANAMKVFGLGAVRGSSSRRAVAALVALRKTLREGTDICITPDGPRGPRHRFQAGALKLAESSGVPLIPIHARFSSCWELKTWDRFRIPKPFSKVTVIFDTALAVPPNLSETDFETWRLRLEDLMTRGAAGKPPSDN